jgi:hypothetical protein
MTDQGGNEVNTYAQVAAGTIGISTNNNTTFSFGEDELFKVTRLTDFHVFVLNGSVMFDRDDITLIGVTK